MTGEVVLPLTANVRLQVFGEGNASIAITARIDTGFNGYLTLPIPLIRLLGLQYDIDREAQMGDGRRVTMSLYRAVAALPTGRRSIVVHESEVPPLIGTELLKGNRLCMDMIDGGVVTIQPLP